MSTYNHVTCRMLPRRVACITQGDSFTGLNGLLHFCLQRHPPRMEEAAFTLLKLWGGSKNICLSPSRCFAAASCPCCMQDEPSLDSLWAHSVTVGTVLSLFCGLMVSPAPARNHLHVSGPVPGSSLHMHGNNSVHAGTELFPIAFPFISETNSRRR